MAKRQQFTPEFKAKIALLLVAEKMSVNQACQSRISYERNGKKRKCFTTNSKHDYPRYPNLVRGVKVERMNQIWVADITYIRLDNEFVYLAVIMDVTSRAIRGWDLSHNIDHHLTMTTLQHALESGTPEIHHSDQGVQYAATEYTDLLKSRSIKISMAEVGKAWQNGYCERLIRTIKKEEIYLCEYQNFADALSNF